MDQKLGFTSFDIWKINDQGKIMSKNLRNQSLP